MLKKYARGRRAGQERRKKKRKKKEQATLPRNTVKSKKRWTRFHTSGETRGPSPFRTECSLGRESSREKRTSSGGRRKILPLLVGYAKEANCRHSNSRVSKRNRRMTRTPIGDAASSRGNECVEYGGGEKRARGRRAEAPVC